MNIEDKAREFATKKHEGQFRKYTNVPYITHPESVCMLLKCFGYRKDVLLAGALLHDTVEMTDTSLLDIFNNFGHEVGFIVFCLTDPTTEFCGNRSERHSLRLTHLKNASAEIKAIKLADIIHNLSDFPTDNKFAEVYFNEKKDQLEVMQDSNPVLLTIANALIDSYLKRS